MSSSPFRIALLYLLISITWIVSGDYLVHQLSLFIHIPHQIVQSSKGLFFVLITAILLYLIIKKHQKSLKESEEKYKNLFYEMKGQAEENRMLAEVAQRVNNMVIITDPQGVISWVNKAFTDFTGYTFDEAAGRYTDFLHGPKTDLETHHLIMGSIERGEFCRFEILNYTKSRQEYWVELNISPIYNEENEIERYISIQNIITERKEKEAKINHQNETLRQIAWTNSHALRKPVASIISLITLCKDVKRLKELKEMHSLIEECSKELDESIREITRKINYIESNTID